jgi:MtN3 and saliva related transmembrane protein
MGEEYLDYITMIGLAAATMGGLALFPQVLKVLKTRSTKDISREMIVILAGSIFLWLVYGILLSNLPIIIANFFGLIQAFIILFFKIKNQIKKTKPCKE